MLVLGFRGDQTKAGDRGLGDMGGENGTGMQLNKNDRLVGVRRYTERLRVDACRSIRGENTACEKRAQQAGFGK